MKAETHDNELFQCTVHFYLYTAFYFVHFHIVDNFEYDALNRHRVFLYPQCAYLQQQQQAERKGIGKSAMQQIINIL